MARGYPDFFGVSIFPWYGAYLLSAEITPIGAGLTVDTFVLNHKAVIMGGYFELNTVPDLNNVNVNVFCDGTSMIDLPLITWITYNLTTPDGSLLYLIRDDREHDYVMWGINQGVSIGQSFHIQVVNLTANPITAAGRLFYANIT